MKQTFFIIALFSYLLLRFSTPAVSQTYVPPNRWQVDSLIIPQKTPYVFELPQNHRIQWQSLNIYLNGSLQQQDIDYRVLDFSAIRFFSTLTAGDSLRIQYRRLPFNLKREYVLFEKDSLTVQDSLQQEIDPDKTVRLREVQIENPFADLSSTLATSGSIMRGIKIGSNRDLTLNSGLNLELSGQLTDNVEVIAALTDEATPIQPEGNTQTLEEVDKVFVGFKSPYVEGTVGDFNLQYQESEFARLSRKLQGLTILGKYGSHQLGATIAATRGYFNRMELIGQEGNQGPYQLTGKNGSRDIIVLAGTERVWINGERLVRGESNDYIIEYGNGQITFTNNRLITSESRIEIDFEYFPAIQKYNRNIYSARGGTRLAKDKLNIQFKYYRESDDPEQILEAGDAIDDLEKARLKQAGDDPFEAFVSGVKAVGDSSGAYDSVQTTHDGEPYTYYQYVGRNQGRFNVSFSFVGQGNGDYNRDRLGVYRWAGIGKGSYLPVKLLPLPVKHDLADIVLEWEPSKYYHIKSEYAVSSRDQNTLSSIDDNNNRGSALQVNAGINNKPLTVNENKLGNLSINLDARYIEDTFESADRFRQPDYRRYWNLLQEDALAGNEELSFQIDSRYRPIESLEFTGNAGRLEQSGFTSQRYQGGLQFDKPEWFTSDARFEYVGSAISRNALKNDWRRYRFQLQKRFWKLMPELIYEGELRKNRRDDVLSGFKFDDFGGRLTFVEWKHFSGSYQYNRRFDSVYDIEKSGNLLPQARTTTQRFRLTLKNIDQTAANIQIVKRKKDYTSRFETIKLDTLKLLYADPKVQDTTWQDRTTNLAELNLNHARWKKALDLSLNYRISSEQAALKEKIYLDVGQGRGNLRFDEDLQEYLPDPDGSYLLFILPSGQFEPVTNFQSSMRMRFDPYKYWRNEDDFYKSLFSKISGESYFRVEEETKEPDVRSIYLLNLNKFQGKYTIRGIIQFDQNFYIMRHNRHLSFRLRYRYRDSRFNQYLDPEENEDRQVSESGIRMDWRVVKNVRSQSEVRYKTNIRNSEANTLRNRDISGIYYDQKISYRPATRWEIGLESEFGRERNRAPTYPLLLWYDALRARLNYAIPGKGRAAANYTYQIVETLENPNNLTIPFEMARGKKAGVSQQWQIRFEYTIAKNVLVSFFYSGRDEPHFERIIHSGQAEIRAFF